MAMGARQRKHGCTRIIYDALAENLDVGGLKDDAHLFQYDLENLQAVSPLNATNAFIVKSEQLVDLLKREATYSNLTVAKVVAVVIPPHPISPSH